MKQRTLAAFLWFYTGWYAGAILADFSGWSPLIGPVLGAAVAAFVVVDPARVIWKRRPSPAPRAVGTGDEVLGPA
jgi:hypothetical protein